MDKRLSVALAAVLASCAPPLAKPDTNIAVSAYIAAPAPDMLESSTLPPAWWQSFGSPALNQLVAASLAANPDIAQASDNLAAANAQGQAASAAYLPQINLNPNATRQSYPTGPNGFPPYTVYSLTGTVSYDPGLFGGRKYTYQNNAAQAAYAQAEMDAARQSLAGNIVAACIARAGVAAQITTTKQIITAEQKLLTLLQGEYEDGAIAQLSVLQQQAQILAIQANLPQLQNQADIQTDRIAILSGVLPASFTPLAINLNDLQIPSVISIDLPSRYLENRPDLRAARAQVAAQNAQLGLAIAHLYPDITLSAQGGYAAETLGALFNTSSALWTLAGNLLQPLYAGGALHARKRQAQAQLAASLAAYRTAVLNAFGEAADAMHAVQNDRLALQTAAQAASTANDAYKLASNEFSLGADDDTDVLIAQATAAQQALVLIQARTNLLLDTARLQAAMAP